MSSPFHQTTRSLAADTATRSIVVWAVAGLLLLGWTAWFLLGRVTVYESSHQAHVEVRQAAHAVAAGLAGRVVANRLAIGMPVRRGEVLVQLDAGSDTLRLGEEQARRTALAGQVAALKAEIAARERSAVAERAAGESALQGARSRAREAEVGLAFATDTASRLAQESRAGSVAAVDAWQARADAQKLQAAAAAQASDTRKLRAESATRGFLQQAQIENLKRTLASLQGEMAMAASTIARLALEIDRHRVRAPVDGRIGDVLPLRAGDVVAAGQKFASVVPDGDLIVVADFEPAAVLGRVHAGQTARLRLDGFPWAQYGSIDASVSRVAGEIRDGRVRVEFMPLASWPAGIGLQHGLPGAVEIVVERVAPAVMVLRASGQWLAGGDAAAKP